MPRILQVPVMHFYVHNRRSVFLYVYMSLIIAAKLILFLVFVQ